MLARRSARAVLVLALAGAVTLGAQQPAPPPAPLVQADELWSQGLFDEAEQIYTRELEQDVTSARARFGVARALAMRSRLDAALLESNAALAAAPMDASILALRGQVLERLYRYSEAAASYQQALAAAPDAHTVIAGSLRSRVTLLRTFGDQRPVEIERDPLGSYTVPFALVNKKVVLRGRVNGAAADFVLDTGSERTTLSDAVASRAGIRPVGITVGAGVGFAGVVAMGIGRADRIEVGDLRIRRVPVSIRATPRMPRGVQWQGEIFSPIALGLSTVVDYERKRVTFTRRLESPAPAAGETVLPLRIYQLPLVRGVLNSSRPAYFVVDTGGELISISADTADALGMRPPRHIPLRVFGTSGLDASAFLLPGVNVAFDEIEYRNFGVAVLNLRAPSALLGFQVGGILGHRFLGGHRVTLDLERSELRLLPSS